MTRVAILGLALAVPGALWAAEYDQNSPEAVQGREEARQTILVPWSESAHTADLKLSKEATHLIDLWLDFCRNKYGERARPSEHFRGVPHDVWEARDGGIGFQACFVNLQIDTARVPLAESPALLSALFSEEFTERVTVDGDVPEFLRMWSMILACEITSRTQQMLSEGVRPTDAEAWQKAWDAAKAKALGSLLQGFDDTPPCEPLEDYLEKTITSKRRVWLKAVAALSAAEAKKLRDRLVTSGNPEDIGAATTALLGARGPEAEDFLVAELKSDDPKRVSKACQAVKPDCGGPVLDALGDLVLKQEAQALDRLGRARDVRKSREVLKRCFKQAPDAPGKFGIAWRLTLMGETDPAVTAALKARFQGGVNLNDGSCQAAMDLVRAGPPNAPAVPLAKDYLQACLKQLEAKVEEAKQRGGMMRSSRVEAIKALLKGTALP